MQRQVTLYHDGGPRARALPRGHANGGSGGSMGGRPCPPPFAPGRGARRAGRRGMVGNGPVKAVWMSAGMLLADGGRESSGPGRGREPEERCARSLPVAPPRPRCSSRSRSNRCPRGPRGPAPGGGPTARGPVSGGPRRWSPRTAGERPFSYSPPGCYIIALAARRGWREQGNARRGRSFPRPPAGFGQYRSVSGRRAPTRGSAE